MSDTDRARAREAMLESSKQAWASPLRNSLLLESIARSLLALTDAMAEVLEEANAAEPARTVVVENPRDWPGDDGS